MSEHLARDPTIGIVHPQTLRRWLIPEITAMQARAIFEAACTIAERKGSVLPEVMIPLTASVIELRKQAQVICQVAEEIFEERRIKVPISSAP